MKKILLLALLFVFSMKFGNAQPGGLDPSFGKKGIVVSDLGKAYNYSLQGEKVLLQPDGSFFAINQAGGQTLIAKKHSNGTIDSSYGRNGFSNFAPVSAIDAAMQPDGKIVVLDKNFVLARYKSNGILDSAFGKNGLENSADFGGTAGSNSIAIQKDGKIIVCGYTAVNGNYYFAVSRYNINGTLDNSFSNDGKIITDFGFAKLSDPSKGNSEYDYGNAVGIQSDGKIVAVGEAYNYLNYSQEFAIARYNTDGNLDSTFDGDGKQTTDFGSDDNGYSLAFQKDGKIVVAGYTATQDGTSYYNFAIARYNSNGSLDNTFDRDGKQITSSGTRDFLFNSVAIQNDGKIVVAAHSWNGSNNDFAIDRYNSDGSLDNTFNGDGKLITDFGSSDDYAASIAIGGDGKILLIGYVYTTVNSIVNLNSVLVRYNSDGRLDNTFDGDGKLIENLHQGNTSYTSSAIQKDGKLVTAGYTWNGNDYDFVVARYNTNGNLDNTFANNGVQMTDFGAAEIEPHIAIQKDGKIVLAGTTGNSGFAIIRYNINGSIDSTFGNGGKQSTTFGFSSASANAIAIQDDGKIVVACSVSDSNFDVGFLIARYNTDGSIDNTFDVDGIQTIPPGKSFFIGYSIAIQSDGKIVAAGYNNNDLEIVRFNTNGSFDNTFDGDGIQTTDFGLTDEAASSVAIQSDGKIIALGGGRGGEGMFLLARYNTNGSLDTAFSSDGKQTNNFGYPSALAIQADGKILGAGTFNGNFVITRYNKNGSPDNTFGNNGVQITDISGADDRLGNVSIAGNTLYAVGYGQFLGTLGVAARYLLVTNKRPTVSITSPVNNTVYTAPATIIIKAAASDSDGTVHSVKFYNGSTYLKTVFTGPYTYTLSNLPPGTYTLTAKATDNLGAQTISAPVKVIVNKAPIVSITSPANNASFTAPASITVNAAASDSDGTIYSVKFYNGTTYLKTDFTSPYSYTLSNLPAGNYSLTVKATDNNGAQTISSAVTVSVKAPNKAPTVSITTPANNSTFAAPANITVNALAADADGSIHSVKFYNGSTYLKTVFASPYTYTLSNLPAGTYSLTAKATDNLGAHTISVPVTVTVSNAAMVSSRPAVKNITDVNEKTSLKLAPNPATNVINIYTTGLQQDKQVTITVISASGAVLKTIQSGSAKTIQLDVSSLVSGVYTIKLASGDKVMYKQFLKL